MPFFTFLLLATCSFGQTIKRIDGTKISADSLQQKINFLRKAANVSRLAMAVFNDNQPVFRKTFGFANVPKQEAFTQSSVMYAASFAKMVFACIAMQFVQEKIIDLDKPLYEYLEKPLTEYKIEGWKRGYQDLRNDDRYKKLLPVCV